MMSKSLILYWMHWGLFKKIYLPPAFLRTFNLLEDKHRLEINFSHFSTPSISGSTYLLPSELHFIFLPHFVLFCFLVPFLRTKYWTFNDVWPSLSNRRQRDFKTELSFCFFPLVITKPIWTRNSNHVCDGGEKEGDTEMGETPGQEYLLLRWPCHDGPAKGHLLLDPLPHPWDMYTLLCLRVSFHWVVLPDNSYSGSRERTFFLGSLWMALGWLSLSSWVVSINHAKWIHCFMLKVCAA